MTVDELLVHAQKYIHKDQAKLLLADLLNKNPLELLNFLKSSVDNEIADEYKKRVEAIKEGKPLQYVIGNVNFYGNKFFVNEDVLIPRFETEELVENTLKYIDKLFEGTVKIIDLGSGSGNIGLTLKQKLPNAEVDLIDISPSALEMSKKNAEELKLEANIYKSDFFDQVEGKYDVVISNPPYIKDGEEIEYIVKNNEPELALFAGVDGLDCYKKIFKDIKGHLNNRFLIALEIGKDQKEDLIKIINDTFDKVRIDVLQDLSERDRMIFIYNE